MLGGTAWLGREVVRLALADGDEVTCLARGSTSVPEGAVLVRADRTAPGAYDDVTGREWDLVVDVSRQPGQVRTAVDALAGSSRHLVLVSSGNVYAHHAAVGEDETAPLLPALEGDVMESMATYGEAKVACEQLALAGFGPERVLVARAGLIGGPGDVFDRTGYWPLRFSRPALEDGSVLVPDAPQLGTSVVDVRDLARWLLDAGRDRVAGTMDAVGPVLPLEEHLETARTVAGHTGPVVRAPEDWLLEQGVEPWMGDRSLPLWLPDPEWSGMGTRDGGRARAAGLVCRPLAETLADTLAWEFARPTGTARRAGLTDDEERALLSALRAA